MLRATGVALGLAAHASGLTAAASEPTAHASDLTTHASAPTAHASAPTAHASDLTAHASELTDAASEPTDAAPGLTRDASVPYWDGALIWLEGELCGSGDAVSCGPWTGVGWREAAANTRIAGAGGLAFVLSALRWHNARRNVALGNCTRPPSAWAWCRNIGRSFACIS